jgi:peroxiredoxin
MKKGILSLVFLLFLVKLSAERDSLTVYIFMSEDCPVCQNQTLPLRKLYETYKDQGVGFINVFSNLSSVDSTINWFQYKYKLNFPTIYDSTQVFARQLNAKITPEVVVVNHSKNNSVVYRGAVDNAYPTLGKRRTVVTQHYLNDALTALLNGSASYLADTKAVGCYITFE